MIVLIAVIGYLVLWVITARGLKRYVLPLVYSEKEIATNTSGIGNLTPRNWCITWGLTWWLSIPLFLAAFLVLWIKDNRPVSRVFQVITHLFIRVIIGRYP